MSKNSPKQNLECVLEWSKELKTKKQQSKNKKGTRFDQYKKKGLK